MQTGFPGWTVATPVGVRPGRGSDEPRVGFAGDPPASWCQQLKWQFLYCEQSVAGERKQENFF